MNDITICVATKEECNRNCKRRHIKPCPYNQSYANFSLDYIKDKKCEAYIGFGKFFEGKSPKIN
jgi:hypothetical protein